MNHQHNRMLEGTRAIHKLLGEWATGKLEASDPALAAVITVAVGKLTPREREVLEECYRRPATMQQIALRLGVSKPLLGVHLHNARQRMMRELNHTTETADC